MRRPFLTNTLKLHFRTKRIRDHFDTAAGFIKPPVNQGQRCEHYRIIWINILNLREKETSSDPVAFCDCLARFRELMLNFLICQFATNGDLLASGIRGILQAHVESSTCPKDERKHDQHQPNPAGSPRVPLPHHSRRRQIYLGSFPVHEFQALSSLL